MSDQAYEGRLAFYTAKFVKPITDQVEDELFTPSVRLIFKSKKWNINSYSFQSDHWQSILPLIAESEAQDIRLSQLCRNSIIKSIVHINFPNLIDLDLMRNRIANLEILQHLQGKMLRKLNLSHNFITNIASLRKTCLPELNSLLLHCNLIISYDPLVELFCQKHFISLKIDYYVDEKPSNEQLQWLAKFPPARLFICTINSFTRITQLPLLAMLSKRYPGIQIENSMQSEVDEQVE